MGGQALLQQVDEPGAAASTGAATLTPAPVAPRKSRFGGSALPFRFPSYNHREDEESGHRQAELFYLQKQIQSQTPMVIVLEDGEKVEGCIEWYDRNSLKVRGRQRMLVYKSAIKYMYKQGEIG